MAKVTQKQVVVDEIKSKIEKAESVVLVNARGLNAAQDTELRRILRKEGIEFKVYKNTMINFAIQGTKFEGLKDYLEGPTTMAISYDEPTKAARVINNSIKTFKLLELKAGVVESIAYDAKGIKEVAEIPTREELLARLLGSFKSPMASFARVINAIAEKE